MATPLGLRGLEQRAQLVPEGIGEGRKQRQRDGQWQQVRRCGGRSLTGATLGVRPLRTGLLRAAETRPPHEGRALLLCRIDPAPEAAPLCQAQVETGGRSRAFFARARWRTTRRRAWAKRANVINRYQARYVRTSSGSKPTAPLASSRASSIVHRRPAIRTTSASVRVAGPATR